MNIKRLLTSIAIILSLGVAAPFAREAHEDRAQAGQPAKPLYHCAMHPQYVSDKPGECPICHMQLVLIDADDPPESAKAAPAAPKKIKFYRNPMQPDVTSPVPMKDDMGMDYVPVYEKEKSEVPVKGRAVIRITPERQQLIGVKTAEVGERDLERVIRASARVAYDPELYNALIEYREALETQEKLSRSSWSETHQRSTALVKAARFKLKQLGLSNDQISNLGRDFPDPEILLLGSGKGLAWIYAQVFELESGLVQAGQKIEVTSNAFPGKAFNGTVKAVDPVLDSETRSLKIRAQVSDPQGLLKPEMYADAKIHVSLGTKLAVPQDAVIQTGERQIAFVDKGNGMFEPRELKLGHEAEGYFEVLSGLSQGEKAVTSANFLIDSESRLKGAAAGGASSGHKHGE